MRRSVAVVAAAVLVVLVDVVVVLAIAVAAPAAVAEGFRISSCIGFGVASYAVPGEKAVVAFRDAVVGAVVLQLPWFLNSHFFASEWQSWRRMKIAARGVKGNKEFQEEEKKKINDKAQALN